MMWVAVIARCFVARDTDNWTVVADATTRTVPIAALLTSTCFFLLRTRETACVFTCLAFVRGVAAFFAEPSLAFRTTCHLDCFHAIFACHFPGARNTILLETDARFEDISRFFAFKARVGGNQLGLFLLDFGLGRVGRG
jgi:hypothetical protein